MDSALASRLRERRLECGLTQADLARRAGVSRQLVAAVEAGQNTPAVDAALRLAQALSSTVELLFAPVPAGAVPALGDRLRERTPLRVGRVGELVVAAELPDHGTSAGGFGTADGILVDRSLRLFAGASLDRLVLAGCDPALGIAETLLAGLGSASVMALPAPTDTALRSLRDGRIHAAAVHGRPGRLPRAPVAVTRLHLASWQVGLGRAAEHAGDDLEALLAGDVPIVQRDCAAASQQALERAAARLGRAVPPGPLAVGHIEAARLAGMLGCAALTTEAAARAFELDFLALEAHAVEIWIAERWVGHPGAQALGSLLAGSAFTARLGALAGYEVSGTGTLVAAA